MTPKEIDQAMQLAVREHQAGRLAEAREIYHRVLARQPDHADALQLLGVLSHQMGQYDSAIELIRKAIAIRPNIADYHNNLGNVLRDQGKCEDAIAAYRHAIQLNPNDAVLHYNLGVALQDAGLADDAIAAYRQALSHNSNLAEAHNNLSDALRGKGLTEAAITAGWQAVRIKPDYAQAHNNLGNALSEKGLLDEAIASYRQAIRLNPAYVEAYNNLGSALRDQGKLDDAIAAYRHVLTLQPDFADAHHDLANALLLNGNFAEGWSEYEWRWQWKGFTSPRRSFARPRWDGSDLAGRTVLLHAEQGLGDTIQFVRYVPIVAGRGGKVLLECQRPLVRLMQTLSGVRQVVAAGDPLPDFDIHCPLASLPLVHTTRFESIPAQVPYLTPDDSLVEKWRAKFESPQARLRVGLAWSGNPAFKRDRARSIRLSQFAPLAAADGVVFYSLQKGPGADQARTPPQGMSLIDFTAEIGDFADTAALVAQLDLVITVDSSVAHLAGAMGKPAWVLLPFMPDWRWLLGRGDSPWYPTMRLFRQKSPGDWSEVIGRVADSLMKLTTFPLSRYAGRGSG